MSRVNLMENICIHILNIEFGGIEPGGQLNYPNPKVRVVDVEVVGDAPHDDQVHPLFLQLPSQGARSSSETGRKSIIRTAMVIQR